jgi:hypothetical protein
LHHHPLFEYVDTACLCCRRPVWFYFTSASDQVVCPGCTKHQGSSPSREKQRHTEDVALWRDDVAEIREQHAQEVASLTERIKELEARLAEEIAKRPTQVVEQWIGEAEVRDAEEQRNAAYRSRDGAMSAICALALIHREVENHECRCGKRVAKCREAQIVEEVVESLDRWETKQIQRLRSDLPHWLPPNHPEVIRPRYGLTS